jgi:hypothetical protein
VAFRQVREHAAEWLQRYPDADAFCRRFTVDRNMAADIASLGEAEGIPFDQKNFDAQYSLITSMLKAYIGDFLYGNDVFHRIALTQDEDLKTTRKFRN